MRSPLWHGCSSALGLALAAVACHLLAGGSAGAQPARAPAAGVEAKQPATGEATRAAAQLAMGQRIYREGVRASGEPLTAVGPARTPLSGREAACVVCHRRSGFGANEGQFVIRPIIGPALREEQAVSVRAPRVKARLGVRVRPPYTEALLARAIRNGIDSAGKPLDPVMPRYPLADEELQALAAYLFSLSAQPSPGVDEGEIHFATVIQPGVAPGRRRAMLEIMQAFVKDKDANTRLEEQRRAAGNYRVDRAYRKWVLHVWELSGPEESWGAQLEAYYKRQPVFALVGGLGAASWGPIHAFSERFEVPSVFPHVDLPLDSGTNNYTFYFSRGVVLEAQVLAKYLREQAVPGKIVQVYRREEVSSAAAAALRAALEADGGAALEDQVLDGPADDALWRTVAARQPAALVLWLGAHDLEGVQVFGNAGSPAVYLSFNLLAGRLPDAALKAGGNIRLVYPSDLPPKRDARLLRNKFWLHSKGIAVSDETVQMNTQFAMSIVGDAMGHVSDRFSRDYFVERIEHVVSQTPIPSVFPHVSLGPGQRFAAKGSSVVQWVGAEKQPLKALSGWIVP